jgi:hypothetical protein
MGDSWQANPSRLKFRSGSSPVYGKEESGRFLKKSGTKNFFETGPVAAKPARPRVNKVFLLLFAHKK